MEDRTKFLGASDVAGAIGLSRWTTPLQVWAEKTGIVAPADLSDNEAVELGTELEDFVAKKFERKTGIKVRRSPKRYVHPKYSWFQCQVDRLIEGKDELLEVKTASAWKLKEWEGEDIPQEYIIQVQTQLLITGRSVGYIACLIGGQKFLWKKIEADVEIQKMIEEKSVQFWQMVMDKTAPMATGDDNNFVVNVYPRHNDEMQLIEEMNTSIRLRQELSAHIDELKGQKEEIEAKLKMVIGTNTGIKTSEYQVTWKTQESSRLDIDRIKADGLYDKYAVTTTTRVLRVKKGAGK